MKAISLQINGYTTAIFSSKSKLQHNRRAMRVTMSKNQSYWTAIASDIESHLKHVIPEKKPLSMFQPMRHLVMAAPQDTAPALCIASCELLDGHRDQAMTAATAIHLMQAALFTHEHLPFIEKLNPTAEPLYDHDYKPNIELLVPDAIVPFGCEILAQSDEGKSELILRVIVEITQAIGSQGMVDGRYHEITCNKQADEIKWAEHVSKKKEGRLHACAAACGAILGGGNEEEIEKLRNFGMYVGMIKGMVKRVGSQESSMKVIEELQDLALREIEDLGSGKIDTFSSLVEDIALITSRY